MEFSTGYTSDFEENCSKRPFIEMGIMKAVNLGSSQGQSLSPYVYVNQFGKEWESKVAIEDEKAYSWEESIDLYIDIDQSFVVMLIGKDELGLETIVSAFLVPPAFLKSLKIGIAQELWVKISYPGEQFAAGLETEDFPVLGSSLIGHKFEQAPMIALSFKIVDPEIFSQYQVRVERHLNVIGNSQTYTLYEICVLRDDGAKWKVKTRYSQIYEIRNKLLRILPLLRKLKFPAKSYFSFLGKWWGTHSKFSIERINERKKGIEDFLNTVLSNISTIRCQSLYSLLQIRRPAD